MKTTQTATSPANLKLVDTTFNRMEKLLFNLADRWSAEKEHEDIAEYGAILAKRLPKAMTFVRVVKAPFGVIFDLDGKRYQFYCGTHKAGWKRLVDPKAPVAKTVKVAAEKVAPVKAVKAVPVKAAKPELVVDKRELATRKFLELVSVRLHRTMAKMATAYAADKSEAGVAVVGVMLAKKLPKSVDFVRISKAPFGVLVETEGRRYRISISKDVMSVKFLRLAKVSKPVAKATKPVARPAGSGAATKRVSKVIKGVRAAKAVKVSKK